MTTTPEVAACLDRAEKALTAAEGTLALISDPVEKTAYQLALATEWRYLAAAASGNWQVQG